MQHQKHAQGPAFPPAGKEQARQHKLNLKAEHPAPTEKRKAKWSLQPSQVLLGPPPWGATMKSVHRQTLKERRRAGRRATSWALNPPLARMGTHCLSLFANLGITACITTRHISRAFSKPAMAPSPHITTFFEGPLFSCFLQEMP